MTQTGLCTQRGYIKMAIFRSSTAATGSISNDGTDASYSQGGTTLWRVRLSDGQFQVSGGYDSDVSL